MSVVRWRFLDTETDETVILPLNPREMSGTIPARIMSYAWASHTGEGIGRPRAFVQTAPNPLEVTFGGVILTQSHHDLLLEWTKRCHVLRVTDHLGRTFEMIIQKFDATERQRTSVAQEWRADYQMSCLLLKEIS